MQLSDTLDALAESVIPADGAGLTVTEVELRVPLEVRPALEDGRLIFLAQPPHSRWLSGFLPHTHMSRLLISVEVRDGR
jgi:hypothetical protein